MKLLPRLLFFITPLWLSGAQVAHSQGCASPNPPSCTFEIFDVTVTPAVKVDTMCVGRRYSFVQCPGRNIPLGFITYGVKQGINNTFTTSVPIACVPDKPSSFIYTPTATEVGDVTVSESSNILGVQFYYIRNVKVVGTPPPSFQVEACPGGSALVTITDTNYNIYTVSGFGTPVPRNVPTRVPLPAGATNITVTGRYSANNLCEGSRTLPISLPVPQQPLLTNLTLQGPLPSSAATLAVGQLPTGFLYTLQKEGPTGTFTDVTTVPVAPGSTILTVSAADGCYRITRRDYCGGSPAVTPAICTLGLTGTSSQNRNQLLLSDGGTGSNYTVTRNGTALTGFTRISGGLEDPNVVCGTTYTYRVTATLPDGTSVSNEFPIPTQSTIPPARPLLVASFNLNNVVELTPVLAAGPALPAGSTLRYRRSAGGQAPADFGTATSLRPRRDSTALAELRAQPPCYSVQLLDVCQNASPESTSTCPALLTAEAADPDGSTATLTWTAFNGPDPAQPASYLLQRLAPDGTVLSTLPVSGGRATDLTPPTDRQVLRYRLQISGGGLPGGTFSYSNLATVSRRILLNMPTAFTPNGDGLNDVLEVKGKYLRNYTFVVVDRNGQEVFRGTQRSEVWDGRIRGHAPVLGAYVWRFQQDGEDGQRFTATGSVTLLQ